ncbi:hypothetical protein BSLA_01r2364, partial [Burkholderia stabilis]
TITRLPARFSAPMSENGWMWCAASSARYSAVVSAAGRGETASFRSVMFPP